MSSEHTFEKDTDGKEFLLGVILAEVEKVAQRLRVNNVKASTVTLKFRYANFRTVTRSKSLKEASNTTERLWQVSKEIFKQWQRKSPGALRLIGFEASGLVPENSGQQLLFSDAEGEKLKRLDKAIDKIKERYGRDALRRRY